MAESSREMAKQGKSFYEISKSQHQLDIMKKSNQSALTALTDTWAGIFYDLSPILIQLSDIIRTISSGIAAVVHNPIVHWLLQHAGGMVAPGIAMDNPLLAAGINTYQAVKGMGSKPPVSLKDLNSVTSPSVNVNVNNEDTHKKLDKVADSIDSLHQSLKNGAINANVFLDSQRLDAQLGRRLAYTGPLTS